MPKTPQQFNAKYNWDKWLNGKSYTIKQGKDFAMNLNSMLVYLRSKAKGNKKRVTIKVIDGVTLKFQAYTGKTPPKLKGS